MAGGVGFDPARFAAYKASLAPQASAEPASDPAPPSADAFDPKRFAAFKAQRGPVADAEPGALQIRVGGGRPVEAVSFGERVAGDGSDRQTWASDTAQQDTPLGRGLRAQADEQLVGPPSAMNAAAAFAMRAGNAAGLNVPRNVGAAIASLPGIGNGRGFDENYRLAKDQDEALGRQHPIAAGAGTVGGIGVGAVGLPAIGSAAQLGRLGQAALTGGAYGFAGELADSKDLGQAAMAAGIGGGLGYAGAAAIDKLAPVVAPVLSRFISRGVPFRGADGELVPGARAALRGAGIDADQIPPQLLDHVEATFGAKGPSIGAAREAQAAEFAIPLSRGQATQDPRALGIEASAAAGTRGGKAQEIAQGFAGRQADAIGAARAELQGMAGRGASLLDNPAAASEAVADRARRAFAEHGFDVAAAQRAEDDALRLARGRGTGDALDAAAEAQGAIRDAAGRSREAYRDAYAAAGRVEGEFRPGAFDRVGERARADLGPGMPIDDVVTPQAAKALADLDALPRLLTKPDGSGATAADVETFRRRLLAYRGATGGNATDRAAIDSLLRTYTGHLENAEGAGLFGPRQAAGPRELPADGFPGFAGGDVAPAPLPAAGGPPARAGEPETLTAYLARSGGVPLDGETRAADLHRAYVPGRGTLARNDAPSWDAIRVRLAEEGFRPPGLDGAASAADVRDAVLGAIHAERTGGRPMVRMGEDLSAGRRAADRLADENAVHAERLAPFRAQVVDDLRAAGIDPRRVDATHLDDAAGRLYRREAETGADAYEAAAMARGGGSSSHGPSADDFVPFDGPTAQAASDALPGGSTELTTALRNARGLFREHQQAFKPRGPGDDAGRLMQQLVEQDLTPAEIAGRMFGSANRPGERGLSVRFAARLREALGEDSPALAAVRQGLIAHALDGNGTGDVGRRLDVLLRHGGRTAANAILTEQQRGALGAFRAAIYETEARRQAVPDWLTGLARRDFDPQAVTADLFGSGVPGARVGAAAYARALKGFLGEGSPEWANVRQAAVSRLLRPDGRDLRPGQEADRVRAFVQGDGAKFAEHLFDAEERARLMRYAAVLRSTETSAGAAGADTGQRRAMVAHLLNGILGAVAFTKTGSPTAAAVPFTTKAGQRLMIGGPGAFAASRSFSGGAPRALPPPAVLDLVPVGTGFGLAAGQR